MADPYDMLEPESEFEGFARSEDHDQYRKGKRGHIEEDEDGVLHITEPKYGDPESVLVVKKIHIVSETETRLEAIRLLGFALFNLNKGKHEAAAILIRKAYKALTGREWDEQD